MRNLIFYTVGAIALMASWACTSTDGDGDGGGGAGGAGGSGGGVACIGCNDWIDSCGTACADSDTICDGAGSTAFDALASCMCGECLSHCQASCTDTGTGTDTANCDTCLTDAMVGAACSAELADCANN